MKKIIYIILFTSLLILPLLIYFLNFKNIPVSDNTEVWGNFGDYLNGTYTPFIALVGIAVTYYLGIISDRRNDTNIKIEQQKHRPILHIAYWDAENHIRIYIQNKGIGPLIITDYKLIEISTQKHKNRLYDCLPKLESDSYNNYTGDITNIVLKPDEKFELFLYKMEGDEVYIEKNRKKIRDSLSMYKIQISYKDVYENAMPVAERSLVWFGRHSENNKSKNK